MGRTDTLNNKYTATTSTPKQQARRNGRMPYSAADESDESDAAASADEANAADFCRCSTQMRAASSTIWAQGRLA